MKNSFKVSYMTTLPKEGNAPRITITGGEPHTYKVYVYKQILTKPEGFELVTSGTCETNKTYIPVLPQYVIPWVIRIHDENDERV